MGHSRKEAFQFLPVVPDLLGEDSSTRTKHTDDSGRIELLMAVEDEVKAFRREGQIERAAPDERCPQGLQLSGGNRSVDRPFLGRDGSSCKASQETAEPFGSSGPE